MFPPEKLNVSDALPDASLLALEPLADTLDRPAALLQRRRLARHRVVHVSIAAWGRAHALKQSTDQTHDLQAGGGGRPHVVYLRARDADGMSSTNDLLQLCAVSKCGVKIPNLVHS